MALAGTGRNDKSRLNIQSGSNRHHDTSGNNFLRRPIPLRQEALLSSLVL